MVNYPPATVAGGNLSRLRMTPFSALRSGIRAPIAGLKRSTHLFHRFAGEELQHARFSIRDAFEGSFS